MCCQRANRVCSEADIPFYRQSTFGWPQKGKPQLSLLPKGNKLCLFPEVFSLRGETEGLPKGTYGSRGKPRFAQCFLVDPLGAIRELRYWIVDPIPPLPLTPSKPLLRLFPKGKRLEGFNFFPEGESPAELPSLHANRRLKLPF